jgi:hypothetical protein
VNRKDVDAIVVATPDHWHARIALEGMDKGKDVYLEKPMCHTIRSQAVGRDGSGNKRVMQIGSQTTSADQWHKAKKYIADGAIGKMLMSQGSLHGDSGEAEWPIARFFHAVAALLGSSWPNRGSPRAADRIRRNRRVQPDRGFPAGSTLVFLVDGQLEAHPRPDSRNQGTIVMAGSTTLFPAKSGKRTRPWRHLLPGLVRSRQQPTQCGSGHRAQITIDGGRILPGVASIGTKAMSPARAPKA